MKNFAELDSPLGPDLLFSHLSAHEGLSEPFSFSITALSKKPSLDFKALLGQHVTVRLHLNPDLSAEPRYFDGLVEQVSSVGQSGKFFQYLLSVRPWFWFLSQTQDCKVFQNQTVLQIIKEVLKDHPIAAVDDRTSVGFTPWVYCVQYRESDFNFLSRLMEQEGIFYYFTHAAGKHQMVLCDAASASDACPGCVPLPVRYMDAAQTAGQDSVWDFSATQRVQPGAAVIQDYDFTRSQVDLRQSRSLAGAHNLGDMEVFDYPGLYDLEGDGEHFVRAQMEEFACAARVGHGSTDARTLSCGGLIKLKLKGSLRETDDGEYLVTAAQTQVNQPAYETGAQSVGVGYQCRFTVLDSSVPYRSARKTKKPVVRGPQTALVVGPAGDEIHTDKYSRVKVQFHWDRYGKKNEKSSCWVRVSSPWAGKSFGFIQVPRMGQEVVVDFLEGDPDQPIITGRVYNAENMPPWELPANATQSGVLTRSSKGGSYGNANALRFEDKKGSEQLWLHAEKNMDTSVENDESRTVGHDQVTIVNNHQTVVVEKGRDVYVNLKGENYYVKGPRNCYYDGKQVQVVTTGYETFTTGERAEYTTGERISFTTGSYKFKSTKAYFDAGPEFLLTGTKFGFIAGGDMFHEATGDANAKAANFKFSSLGNFSFTGNQFNRTIFEGNDTILGPNTNTYIGVSRDTAVGSASQTFIGTQNSVTTGMSISGYLGMQISNFIGLALSNAVAVSMDNAAINLGMTGVDLTVNGISLDNNAIKLLNAGGAAGPGAAAAFSAGPGLAATAAAAFGLGFGLAYGGSMSISAYQQAQKDIQELMDTPGLTPATKARLQAVLDSSSGFTGGNPARTAEGARAEAEPGRQAQLQNLVNPPATPPAPGAVPPPAPPQAPPALVAPPPPAPPTR